MAREIKGGSNLGSPGRFWKALFFHHRFTEKPELYTTECMNTVVDTMVVRDIASGHSVVGGIDNGVTFQGGNVPLPQVEAVRVWGQICKIRYTFFSCFFLKIGILNLQEFLIHRAGRPYIEKPP